jgi:alpha-D-ribose 1-methylphosphonate 5-triphosphate synthase subunit PhnL
MTMARDHDPEAMLRLQDIEKTFVMHLRGGMKLPVVRNVSFHVSRGECVALDGSSGAGKSSILKMIFGNYRVDRGSILVRHDGDVVDLAQAQPRQVVKVRQRSLGYVSQFLRTIPRVSCLDLVVASAREGGATAEEANARARELLERLNLPERLWMLAPATFSGGEQQRVNIACGFAAQRPIMLLDEPTASLDGVNGQVVTDIIAECKARGTAMLGIFHDPQIRARVADRIIPVKDFAPEHTSRG